MSILVHIIGIFITTVGILIFVFPKHSRRMMLFWRQGNNLYAAGAIRILLGSIFLFSARLMRLPQVIFILGILMFLGGLLIFMLGLEKVKAIIEWMEKKPEAYLRLISLLALAFGVLVIYSA
jgi:uncharacterized protein YjeT (DUF2065 family)